MRTRLYIAACERRSRAVRKYVVGGVLLLTASCMRSGETSTPGESTAAAVAAATVADSTATVAKGESAPPSMSSSPATSPQPAVPAISATAKPASFDTLRGVVQRIGNDPVSVMVLTVSKDGKRETHALRGDARTLLERVSGLEVVVRGSAKSELDMMAAPRGAPVFEVTDFAVRAADGVAAVDGVLSEHGGKYVITTSDGVQHEIRSLPSQLRSQMGARVFLVGSLREIPSAYGVITPR